MAASKLQHVYVMYGGLVGVWLFPRASARLTLDLRGSSLLPQGKSKFRTSSTEKQRNIRQHEAVQHVRMHIMRVY